MILFHSTAHAIRAESVLKRAGVPIKMIPTPRQLSSDCGMALRLGREATNRAAAILAEHKVPVQGIYPI
ncbi:MAG: DUF3343 domain-containing protein [Anaerolineae bacterium]